MMALAEKPDVQPTWDSVRVNDVLSRLSARLDTTASMIAKVEASLGILILDAKGLSPELIKDLQEIDLARQSICDVGRVLRLVSGLNNSTSVNSAAMASVIHLRDIAEQVLCGQPSQPRHPDPDTDSISWF
jgi:hypothetical protein